MGTSRIEQVIEDIYEFVESCKMQAFSTNKVVVPKGELYDLLDELKLRTPEEIKRYQKIIANRDSILSDAERQAEEIIQKAQSQTQEMINESGIVQQAYERADAIIGEAQEQANQIIQEANEDAGQIRVGALSYAEEMLGEVEKVVGHAYESAKSRCDNLVETLRGNLEVLTNNRNEIVSELYGRPTPEAAVSEEESGEEPQQEYQKEEPNDEEYHIDEDAFLKNIDQQ